MGFESLPHVLLVSFPAQGHVKPILRLAKRLASKGLLVTFTTTERIGKEMQKASNNITDEPTPVGDGFIRFEFFDPGSDENDPRRFDIDQLLRQLDLAGKEVIPRMLRKHAGENRPVSCIINNLFIPWVSEVADSLGIPSALLWHESCAGFAAYYHYYHGLVPFPSETEPTLDVQLPCMPLLKYDEVPTFLHPATPVNVIKRAVLRQCENLDKSFCILMETFEELEPEIVDYMSKLCPIKTVGPLFKNSKESKTTVHGDFVKADDCMEWLDSRRLYGVARLETVLICRVHLVDLKKDQVDEIAYGLLNSGISFMWVMKPPDKESGLEPPVLPDGFLEKVGEKGKVVQWSPQEKVLAHPSVACFMTHCGWNSTIETLTSGVPVLAFPRWSDQVTNSKYLVDVFKVGVRMSRGEAENRIIPREEVEKLLLEATAGPKVAEKKQNALKWKAAAEAAVAEGGSSDRNIEAFVDEVRKRSAAITKPPRNAVF